MRSKRRSCSSGGGLLRTWDSPTLRLAWHWSPGSGVSTANEGRSCKSLRGRQRGSASAAAITRKYVLSSVQIQIRKNLYTCYIILKSKTVYGPKCARASLKTLTSARCNNNIIVFLTAGLRNKSSTLERYFYSLYSCTGGGRY